MAETAAGNRHRRHAWLAVVLSFVTPGLGHIYCGRFVRGLVFVVLCFVPILFVDLAFITSGAGWIVFVILGCLVSLALPVVAAVDGYKSARRTRPDYAPKEYNRWYVYLLVFLVAASGSLHMSLPSALYIRATYIEPFRVPAWSMYPTIRDGDRLLADKVVYCRHDPRKGDIVVFKNPQNHRMNYIKRIVAVAGETVRIEAGDVYVNGHKLTRRPAGTMQYNGPQGKVQGQAFVETNGQAEYTIFLASDHQHAQSMTDFGPLTVPDHHCFLLGDNRNSSLDSRQFGPVPLATIFARANYLYFPAKDWSRFGRLR